MLQSLAVEQLHGMQILFEALLLVLEDDVAEGGCIAIYVGRLIYLLQNFLSVEGTLSLIVLTLSVLAVFLAARLL